jgi:hypothetical protein
MKRLNIVLSGLNNGTWVATLHTSEGPVVTVNGQSPVEAAVSCLEKLGMGLAAHPSLEPTRDHALS